MRKTGGALPELENKEISMCSADIKGRKKLCSREKEMSAMRKYLKSLGKPIPEKAPDVVIATMKELQVENEADIFYSAKFRWFYGGLASDESISKIFKPLGPKNNTNLLDNYNIDNSIRQWAENGEQEFKKRIKHIPFQMIDFEERGTELSRLKVDSLIGKYDCFAVVFNTDVSTGRGKHWFCVYGDLQHKGDKSDPIALEYFNSSGLPPRPQCLVWLEKTRSVLLDKGIECKIIYSTKNKQIQFSKTECGVWSLLYILSRLEGHPSDWLLSVKADDSDMIKYRKHLFR